MYSTIIEDNVKEWTDHLSNIGRKDGTLRMHRTNVNQCLRCLSDNGRLDSLETISKDDVLFLWKHLDVCENTRWQYICSLASLVRYHTGRDIRDGVDILRNRSVENRVFIDMDQFSIAFREADPMMRVVLSLGVCMGLRRAEILDIRDSDIVDSTVLIHGKGHGDGLMKRLDIPDEVMSLIIEYRGTIGDRRDDRLIQIRGRDGSYHGIAPNHLSTMVSRLGRRCGFRMTTHSLRRLFATTLYHDVGADYQTVKNLLRHADISTSMRCYIDACERKEKEASERLMRFMRGRF